jgi:hypothetical protein
MYTIYHIPKRKEWGCTKNLNKRVKDLGYTISDVKETIVLNDLDLAANMERDLNIKYGYGWNSSRDYRLMVKRAIKSNVTQSIKKLKSSSIQGKITGNKNVETGHLKSIAKLGGIATASKQEWKVSSAKGGHTQSQIVRECPHCNKIGKGNAMFVHHFDKCKNKK